LPRISDDRHTEKTVCTSSENFREAPMDIGAPETEHEIEIAPLEEPVPVPAPAEEPAGEPIPA
jgi:hypothetical protein